MFTFLKFLLHIKKNFSQKTKIEKNLILVEFPSHKSAMIGLLYLLKTLKKAHSAKIIIYFPGVSLNIMDYFKNVYKMYTRLTKQTLIYKTLGWDIKILKNFKSEDPILKKKYKELLESISKKEDVSSLRINNILVGDLFYDTYTRYNAKPTIVINSIHFKREFLKYLREFDYWYNLIKKGSIKSIIVSHPVYNLAIPLRIGQYFDIPVYIGSINFLQYFDKHRKHLWETEYRDQYKLLSEEDKIKALNYSKKELELKFDPNQNIFSTDQNIITERKIHWSKLDTFSPIRKKDIFIKNGKPNVVILAHCFYDSPHNEGEWIFADFYEWAEYLLKISKNTDYNWYIKKHPASVNQKLNDETIENLVNEYPNVKILEDVNNTELLADNVSLILTAFGSAGYEFSYHKVPVILASNSCSYVGYNFAYKPKDVEDFDYAIKNFQNIKFNYEKKDIYKFYFNQMLTYWNLYPNYQNYKANPNNNLATDDEIFKQWMGDFSKEEHNKNLKNVEDFIISKKSQLVTNKFD